MDQAGGDGATRRLRAVDGTPVVDARVLSQAIADVLAASPGGLAPRALPAAVAERLGVAAEAVDERELTAALGTLFATGRVDEAGGRLTAVPQERREAG
ncbi:MAG TPA: hypothetical protein VL422_02720 [Miltoncostaea sp.]|nr:hypothetical protein [Miltoncostaea sp.]